VLEPDSKTEPLFDAARVTLTSVPGVVVPLTGVLLPFPGADVDSFPETMNPTSAPVTVTEPFPVELISSHEVVDTIPTSGMLALPFSVPFPVVSSHNGFMVVTEPFPPVALEFSSVVLKSIQETVDAFPAAGTLKLPISVPFPAGSVITEPFPVVLKSIQDMVDAFPASGTLKLPISVPFPAGSVITEPFPVVLKSIQDTVDMFPVSDTLKLPISVPFSVVFNHNGFTVVAELFPVAVASIPVVLEPIQGAVDMIPASGELTFPDSAGATVVRVPFLVVSSRV